MQFEPEHVAAASPFGRRRIPEPPQAASARAHNDSNAIMVLKSFIVASSSGSLLARRTFSAIRPWIALATSSLPWNLPQVEILEGELGARRESRAQRVGQVREQGEHGRMTHDSDCRLPCSGKRALTDRESWLRLSTWRGPERERAGSLLARRRGPSIAAQSALATENPATC